MRRLLLVFGVLLLPCGARAETPVTFFAAASLTNALQDIDAAWERAGHPAVKLSLAASSTLAQQIAQGAPADLFGSADEKWMDFLAEKGLIAAGTRRDLLSNDLVLVVPANQATTVKIGPGFDLKALLKGGRLAVGDPAHVPAGIYAKQALIKLKLWDGVKDRLAPAEDVRAALLLVERGEAPAGIVYGTDAASSKGVAVAGVFPAGSHDPIAYPFAVVKAGDTPQARALLQYLQSPASKAIFRHYGFTAAP